MENSKENLSRDPNISRLNMSSAGNMSYGTPTMAPPGSGVGSPFTTPRSARPLQRAFSSTHMGDVSTVIASEKIFKQENQILQSPFFILNFVFRLFHLNTHLKEALVLFLEPWTMYSIGKQLELCYNPFLLVHFNLYYF